MNLRTILRILDRATVWSAVIGACLGCWALVPMYLWGAR